MLHTQKVAEYVQSLTVVYLLPRMLHTAIVGRVTGSRWWFARLSQLAQTVSGDLAGPTAVNEHLEGRERTVKLDRTLV